MTEVTDRMVEAEPVAWLTDRETMYFDREDATRDCDGFIQPLYTHPSQPDAACCTRATCRVGQRVPLTKEELRDLLIKIDPNTQRLPAGFVMFARRIELAHGIGDNT